MNDYQRDIISRDTMRLVESMQHGNYDQALAAVRNMESILSQIAITELTARDYEKALQFYDGAVNSSAAFHELHRLTPKLRELKDEDYRKHPIIRLYLAQLSFLAGIGIGECGGADDEARKALEEMGAKA